MCHFWKKLGIQSTERGHFAAAQIRLKTFWNKIFIKLVDVFIVLNSVNIIDSWIVLNNLITIKAVLLKEIDKKYIYPYLPTHPYHFGDVP